MPESTSDHLIDEDTARFLLSGLSISVASCDESLRPSLVRACGVRLPPDRRCLRVIVVREQSTRVLADVAALRRAAAVFSETTSHRTLQIKSADVWVEAADAEDRAAVDQHVERFAAQLDSIGHPPAFTQALLGHRDRELAVVVMRPAQLFSQTPGPHAGLRLRG